VTVTDNNNCTKTASIAVGEASALAISLISKTDRSCTGGNDGAIDISASGGALPYNFIWSNGIATEDISGLAAGSYTVTVTDDGNCSKVENYSVNAPPVISATVTRRNISCDGGSDGSANLTVSGGSLPYNFIWSNAAVSEDISGLSAGFYFVSVSDANGCSVTTGTLISEPSSLNTTAMQTDVKCNGGADGLIDLTVAGGTPPYQFDWSNAGTTEDISSLSAGIYDVTITDSKGCTTTASNIINQPNALAASASQLNVSCNGGSDGNIHLDVSGGITPYDYDWSNGATTDELNGLTAGAYNVSITDFNGCSVAASANITEPDLLISSFSQTDVSCFAGNNGSITSVVSGGASPYDFIWSNGESSENLTELFAGNFSVTITDNNGCSVTGGASIKQPFAINVSVTITNLPCSGGNSGAIDITVLGGTSSYTFLWNNNALTEDLNSLIADTYTVTVTDNNGCFEIFSAVVSQSGTLEVAGSTVDATCSGLSNGSINLTVSGGTPGFAFSWSNGSSSQNISDLAAGNYSVTVTDANGCSLASVSDISEPSAITVSNELTDVTCYGAGNGEIALMVGGGNPPYTFNWSNGASDKDIGSLPPGTYSVIITDDNLCTVFDTASISEPDSISLSGNVTHVSLVGGNEGSVSLEAAGGTFAYTFEWSNGSSAQDISNLSANSYCVTVTDDNSCSVSKCFAVTEPVSVIEKEILEKFSVFSSNGNLFVHVQLKSELECGIQLYDLTGRLLKSHHAGRTSRINLEIPAAEFSSGCYIIAVTTELGSVKKKVIFFGE